MRKAWLFWLSCLFVFGLDRATKIWAESSLQLHESVPAILGAVQWTLMHNPGAAGGILQGYIELLIAISTLAVLMIVWYVYKGPHDRNLCLLLGLGFMCGGTLGNLFDRIFFQYVIDFIDPIGGNVVYNIADKGIRWGMYLTLAGFAVAELRRFVERRKNVIS